MAIFNSYVSHYQRVAACQSQVEELKQMRTESKSQQEELIKALQALATAVVGTGVNVRDYTTGTL